MPKSLKGVAVFSFKRLCGEARGAADYLAIARAYHTVIVVGIPVMGPEMRNEAARFVTLIDTLYEHNVKLLATAAAEPEGLYPQGDGSFEFERTVSRLKEMQSADYLAGRPREGLICLPGGAADRMRCRGEIAMLVSTTENVAGYRTTETIGQVFGVVVRSRGLGGNIVAGLRSIIGGEIVEYTSLVEDTRRQAIDRLVMNARLMGADAVVMMRFDSGAIGQTMNEVVAYGTAVKLAPHDAAAPALSCSASAPPGSWAGC